MMRVSALARMLHARGAHDEREDRSEIGRRAHAERFEGATR
jgi:hypothetical protein